MVLYLIIWVCMCGFGRGNMEKNDEVDFFYKLNFDNGKFNGEN